MKNESRTRPPSAEQKRELVRATASQLVRQGILVIIVIALWAGLLAAFLNLTGKTKVRQVEVQQPTQVAVALEPTRIPTSTEAPPTVTATNTIPAPTETSEATSGPVESATESPEVTDSPTVVPTETEVPLSPTSPPTATETRSIPAVTPTVPAAASVSFSEDVLSILTSRCRRCHGDDGTEAGLYLLSYAGVMAGSENGPVVVPSDSATSSLVQQIISGEMPRRAPRLPASEIETIATWVDEGAQDN